MFGAHRAAIRDNELLRLGDYPDGISPPDTVRGITLDTGRAVVIAGNRLLDIGPTRNLASTPTEVFAVHLVDIVEAVDIADNTLEFSDPGARNVACGAVRIRPSAAIVRTDRKSVV